jgi:hypothetical protein
MGVMPWLKSLGQGDSAVMELDGIFQLSCMRCSLFACTGGMRLSTRAMPRRNYTLSSNKISR